MATPVTVPCGCLVTRHGGHTRTVLCQQHRAAAFGLPAPKLDNSDLLGDLKPGNIPTLKQR